MCLDRILCFYVTYIPKAVRFFCQACSVDLAWITRLTLYLCRLSSCPWPLPLLNTIPVSRLLGALQQSRAEQSRLDRGIRFPRQWSCVHAPYLVQTPALMLNCSVKLSTVSLLGRRGQVQICYSSSPRSEVQDLARQREQEAPGSAAAAVSTHMHWIWSFCQGIPLDLSYCLLSSGYLKGRLELALSALCSQREI